MGSDVRQAATLGRRSFLLRVGGIAAASALGVSCSAGPPGCTLRFFEQKQEVIAYFDKLLRAFEAEHSGVTVVHDTTSSIAPQFVRNEPADVGCFNDNLELARYIKRGQLSDLSHLPSAQRIRTDIGGLTDQYATYPGRTAVLPYSLAAAGVIYNRKIFADHKLPVPTTWSEFVAVCTELKRAGVVPVYATGRTTWTIWQGLFDYSVGSLVDTADFFATMNAIGPDVGPDSEVSFQKTFAVAMERAKTISTFFNPDHAVRSYEDGNLAFGKGQAAMYLQGPWAIGQIALVDPKLDLGTFALPVSEDPKDRKARVNVDLGLYIPQRSADVKAAGDLVEFLMRPEIINAYNQDNLAYATTKDAPPQRDQRLAGLQTYVDRGAFYQGAGTFIPASVPLGNYLQSAISSGNFDGLLKDLDADWRRLDRRGATT